MWVGIIALAGLDAETGVVMLLYLDLAYDDWSRKGRMRNASDLRDAIYHGAVKRVRPKAMTACGHHRRPGAHSLEPRRRRGRDETHRHADDRRRRHLDHDGIDGLSGDLLRLALPAFQVLAARRTRPRNSDRLALIR